MTSVDDLHLTSQELTYLDTGHACSQSEARVDGERQASVTVSEIFEGAGLVHPELALATGPDEGMTRRGDMRRGGRVGDLPEP
jgi:hypothetical protein